MIFSTMHPIIEMLKDGDRRSIGRASDVVGQILKEPDLFDLLISGMCLDDPILRMRCADAAEKITAIHPEYLLPHKNVFLTALTKVDQAEVRWHVAPMLARLPLSDIEQKEVAGILTVYLKDRSSIVKTASIQALFDLAMRNHSLLPLALRHIKEVVVLGTPAMQARSRKLLAKISRLTATSTRSDRSAGAPESAG